MHWQGQARRPSNPTEMPATDDEIREKYLERAIRELNAFAREVQGCQECPRGSLMPVLGSGHPQADVFLLKLAPMPSEIVCRRLAWAPTAPPWPACVSKPSSAT